MAISADELFLRQALELAARGLGRATPNPLVGAVVVDERGRIVGSGTHVYAERKHAEVLAIEQAGQLAFGNTLYVNLEPCSHTGRTAPCADAVIAAGITRVVCCMEDPNPLVAGKGFAKLRAAGIEVEVGLLETEAKRLNESFAQFIRTGLPFVTLKAAMSLDGKIAGPVEPRLQLIGSASPNPSYITGEAARRRVHEMRHASDAILVGVGTVIADDPLLTDRSGRARRRPLLRVILDSRLRIPMTSRVVETAQDDLIVFCSFAEENKRRALEARGVRVQQVGIETLAPGSEPLPHEGRPDLHRVFHMLGAEQITSLLVEGGAAVNWACLRERLVDKLMLFYTPRIFGPVGAVPWLAGQNGLPAGNDLRSSNITIERFGEDFAIEAYLRDPYQPLRPQG
ncbi:MAG TPA: bifunctional diaminohydroxyphosphoribosylaminopyrimidine deaminase/5-amino-6-(5-phosphoribosylamino)uracil reductase RibD [Candidatus Saccharimonadales bacterium]|nr:bifunctional diaminohydroxyphosphoribosylaminopyrimidine deaminase/5-amino-6-(5-phosphoribosylamino)uracil reductase RibD [Candidatus Saccharimonadales bacterium]